MNSIFILNCNLKYQCTCFIICPDLSYLSSCFLSVFIFNLKKKSYTLLNRFNGIKYTHQLTYRRFLKYPNLNTIIELNW